MNIKDAIEKRAAQGIDEKVFPGCVVGVVSRTGERNIFPVGKLTYEDDSPIVREDTIYDVASITKSVPGSSVLLALIDEGKLKLDDRLADYIPEFANQKWKEDVLIKHLLTYTVDFLDVPSMSTMKDKSPEEIVERIISAPLRVPPGTSYVYGNPTALLIGLVIQKITGAHLDTLADKYFFEPLGMRRTTFHPDRFNKSEIAPTEIDSAWRKKVVHAEVHDESASVLMRNNPTAIAGLFSTVPDMLTFQEMLLNDGVHRGKRYFSPEIIKQMFTNQVDPAIGSVGLGWELNKPSFMGRCAHDHMLGKTGFTGCVMVVDPERKLGFALFSNRTYPKRPADNHAINEVRRDVADIVFG